MKKKAQVSTEYLIVFGIAFLVIVAGTVAFMKFAKSGALTEQQSCLLATGEHVCLSSVAGTSGVSIEVENAGDKMVSAIAKATVGSKTCTSSARNIESGATSKFMMSCGLTKGTKVNTDFTIT